MLTLKDTSLLRQANLINGQWQAAADNPIKVANPATGAALGVVPRLGAAETSRVIEATQAAFPAWRDKLPKERAGILRMWAELIHANIDDLALLLTSEQGKPIAEAKGELGSCAAYLEWFAEEARRIYGDIVPPYAQGRRSLVIKQPVGVCAAITPWNFPASMIARKVAPALAAGCTIIVKPASATPLIALAVAELGVRAGIPAGVLNVITGDAGVVGDVLATHPLVRKISFTGSTEIGKQLMAKASGTMKRISLELGGNAPFIVFDDADLDKAVEGAMASKYRNSGQTCICANRFLVHEKVADAFAEKLAKATAVLNVGDGTMAGTQQGPLINIKAVEKVEELVADALRKGAKIVTGGKRHSLGGSFYEPTVLSGVTASMKLAREEIFGPVAPVFKFKDEAEAIALANATEYGLASYFYTRDIGRVWRVAEALQYGMVSCNEGLLTTETAPFGGVKDSGIGREGGRVGIDEYLDIKYIQMGGL
jgi:succinate-semialdehyde dehydrogenase / glutarate-semialdehyde dehydrogenase